MKAQRTGTDYILFLYDENGSVYGLKVYEDGTATYYYFVLNVQGDVIGILDDSGQLVVKYEYDEWGKILSVTDANGTAISETADHISNINPIRYRGYYYDNETGFYYLNSRYYDPEVSRFINADEVDLLGANNDFASYNLFAYCGNNPITRRDISGYAWETVLDIISLGASIVEVCVNPTDPWAWAGLAGDVIDLIPFITCVGEAVDTARITKKASDLSEEAVELTQDIVRRSSGGNGWHLGDDITKLTRAGNSPSWTTIRQRYWKNKAISPPMGYSQVDINRMKRGLAPIGSDGFSLHLHHPSGRIGDNIYLFEAVTRTQHIGIHRTLRWW